ncbi:hypothetical protein BW723_12825 [Polaribacter reichenbachii]|uniref:Uncharacterized protein n=1 Tax=Polaribacter reichenbachii TaxID=996801 RepID=A0A1B8U015_9FLAO|nr:hypothetical protein [Polaribacter reichenbachii]APZ47112.1 hypothetical protein BW723_12825 [Polaribacter reichenbachii]AUC17753.1 hypothetical protein BTO17_03275 [Polaribacter reichenbachii]OBY65224.1 hypothetical protein LPB301_08950 [Polaribacter reichenbachii]
MKQEGFIFVLMPFDSTFDDIYNFGIKQTANKCGFYCERVDEQIFEGSILTRIYNQIEKADIIIADLSNKNPNVFYETGYAHALNKNVILLTQKTEDIPFDLKHYPHIIYKNNIGTLSESLELKLNWFKKNKNEERADESGFIEFYNDGNKIEENGTVIFNDIEHLHPFIEDEDELAGTNHISFTLNLYNSGNKIMDTISDLGLEIENIFTDSRLNDYEERKVIQLPNNKVLIPSGYVDLVYPKSWSSLKFYIGTKSQFKKLPTEMVLKVYKENGVNSIPLKIEYRNVKIK